MREWSIYQWAAVCTVLGLIITVAGLLGFRGVNADDSTTAMTTSGFVSSTTTTTVEATTTQDTALTDDTDSADDADAAGTSGSSDVDSSLRASYIDQFETVDESGGGYITSGTAKVNAHQFIHAVSLNAGCQNSGNLWAEYDLSRSWTNFTATVGLDDASTSNAHAFFAVYGDGEKLAEGEVSLGVSVPVRVSVDNVLRLRIEITDPGSPDNMCGFQFQKAIVVYGDPAVQR